MTPERVVTPTRLPYWFEPVPERRLTLFARVCGATVLWMLWGMDTWAASHATAPRSLWAPVALARWISQPAPGTITLTVLRIVLTLAAACLVLLPDRLGRPRRWAAAVAAPTWLLWITWAFSWSKVDHDRLTMTVALTVLALVPAALPFRADLAGWALRTVQVVFALAYPLSALTKFRVSGWAWANSATFARAIVRRGTFVSKPLLQHPELLRWGQWTFLLIEIGALALLSRRQPWRNLALVSVALLHLFTWAAIQISFLPHTICLAAFLPLERLCRRRGRPVDPA